MKKIYKKGDRIRLRINTQKIKRLSADGSQNLIKSQPWNVKTKYLDSLLFLHLSYLSCLSGLSYRYRAQALIHEGQFSLANFVTFFSKAYYSETLVNSFKVSITATVTSLVVGTLLAPLFHV